MRHLRVSTAQQSGAAMLQSGVATPELDGACRPGVCIGQCCTDRRTGRQCAGVSLFWWRQARGTHRRSLFQKRLRMTSSRSTFRWHSRFPLTATRGTAASVRSKCLPAAALGFRRFRPKSPFNSMLWATGTGGGSALHSPRSNAEHVPLWHSTMNMPAAAMISLTFDRRDCSASAVGRCASRLSYSPCRGRRI